MGLALALNLILVGILVVLSGFFSASEIAIIAIRPSRLKEIAKSGDKRALFVEKLKNNPDSFFAIVQIGMTVTASAASAIGGALAITLIGPFVKSIPIKAIQSAAEPISVTLVVILISYLFLVVAELVPKAVAIRRTEPIALFVGPLTWYSIKTFNIVIKILTLSTNFCLRLMGLPPETRYGTVVSEAEVEFLIKEGMEHGVFDKEEQQLIHSVFEFTDTTVERAMTPRIDMVAIEMGTSVNDMIKIAMETNFSRFPIYEESLDNIKGIIHSKDLLYVHAHRDLFVLSDVIRPAYFVPNSQKISELLRDMQKKHYQMAIVLDEFGGTAGLITIEDIVEEIVGDIMDEYDQEASKISFSVDKSATVLGSMPVDEFANEFGVEVPKGEYNTINGLIITRLGKIPALDETVDFGDYTLQVLEKEGHKIKKLIARKKGI